MSHPLEQYIQSVPDFPQKGVIFRDISPLLAKKFPEVISELVNLIPAQELEAIDGFAGIDSRGFIFASALAAKTEKQFIMPRKAGKLPVPYAEKEYALEYANAKLQLKHGNGNIMVVDDVLATGGTLGAAADLCVEAGYTVHGFMTLIDLQFLNDFSWNGLRVRSLIQYKNP